MTEELLINGGADMIKVGIGSGSVCTTRLQTGVGMPQLSAVMECSDAAHGVGGHIISDGGITCPGDISKALGGGADFVMLGSMLSGHDESAGEMVEENGNKYKLFYGMSSSTAMNKYHGGVAKYRSSEGKTVRIKYKGAVSDTMDDILGGVRSTCTYIGATRIKDIPKCCTFMMVNRQVNTVHNGKEV
jgi:GMP reductase